MVTRCDTNVHTYAVDILPRPPRSAGVRANGKLETFREFGGALLQATLSNNGVPPACAAWDGSTAHTILNRAFLGIASGEELQSAEFFNQCTVRKLKLIGFSFGCLYFQDDLGEGLHGRRDRFQTI